MEKQKKRFSRQSTADINNPSLDNSKQGKIQRRTKHRIPPINQVKPKEENLFKQEESVISHLTKRSLFDRKSSHQSSQRPKSLALTYRNKNKQAGIFGLEDQQFLNLYRKDPFAKQKIDYVIKKNEQKLRKNRNLAAAVKSNNLSNLNSITHLADNHLEDIKWIMKQKTFVRCKSQSDLIEAQQCLHYQQLIVTNSQAYSGCSV